VTRNVKSDAIRLREWQQPKRPFVLGLFAGGLIAQAVLLPIVIIVVLVSPSDTPVTYNGVEVLMGDVRLKLLGILVLWSTFAAYVGPGLWRGKPMTRTVVATTFVVAAVINLAVAVVTYPGKPGLLVAVGYVIASSLIGWGIVGWYLYLKPNVREFFERKSNRFSSAA
jgi:hypothetical protein